MRELIDLHTHTVSSGHAYSTVKENIDSASNKGLRYLGISDHAPQMPGSAHIFHFHNLRVIPKEINNVRTLVGAEVNILDYEGNLDLIDKDLEMLDYAIASLHATCIASGTEEENTIAVINAMDRPNIKIIGHLDDARYPVNYEKVVKAAKEKGVLLELNNSSLKPNGFRKGALENDTKMLNICKKEKVKIIFGSDAHICYDIGKFDNCIKLVKELDFPEELIVNYNEDDIKEIFKV
ncbi:phosphatase [Clostridium sardiniense]|uniref:phosphatase n=1 Tax=Clostridium sardiniense TaxID=29369 RepID=UPI003D33B7A7